MISLKVIKSLLFDKRSVFEEMDICISRLNLHVMKMTTQLAVRDALVYREREQKKKKWIENVTGKVDAVVKHSRKMEINGVDVDPNMRWRILNIIATGQSIVKYGTKDQVDTDALDLACSLFNDFHQYSPSHEIDRIYMSSPTLAAIATKSFEPSPKFLYHGSAFLQKELKPGYRHTKKTVTWDKYESNHYLYSTSSKENAILLGISSSIEKAFDLKSTHFDHSKKILKLVFYGDIPSLQELMDVKVYLYTLPYCSSTWKLNNNPVNRIKDEYKTTKTITELLDVEPVDVSEVLKTWEISLSKTEG